MAVCDCCGSDKPDVRIRVGLRGLAHRGHRTAQPFHGPLCNECLSRTKQSRIGGTPLAPATDSAKGSKSTNASKARGDAATLIVSCPVCLE
jgi:hypothetical protein